MKNDRDRMKCIISETIVALCNSGLDFSSELCVEGLLGITLDGRDILLVNINEVIKSGVSGAKTLPLRNVDAESERVFSEVTTSSDPTRMTAETHARISVTASSSCEQIASQPMPVQRQTEPFAVNSLTSVKSEPVRVIEDNKEEVHSIIDIRTIGDVSWTEHGIADAVQPAGSDMDESYVFAEQAAEEQCCKLDNSNTPEHICDLTELSSDEAGSLAIMQQQTHPVCLYTNTARSRGASTSSASETRHSQMSSMSSQSKYRRYNQASLKDAVAAVINHKMTSNQASRFFNVPRSTVRFQASKLSLKNTTGDLKDKRRRSGSETGGDETDCKGQEQHKTVWLREDSASS